MPISIINCLTISFKEINFKSPLEEAREIKDLVVNFLKENPSYVINFDFEGYARLSQKFADELFKDGSLHQYLDKIKMYEIHVFDEEKLTEAIQKVKK